MKLTSVHYEILNVPLHVLLRVTVYPVPTQHLWRSNKVAACGHVVFVKSPSLERGHCRIHR